eukprot:Nitzschia sp. Nitz4//scaffold14_size191712//66419//68410//NITZ4_001714-RA/size191712-processed-gene-0.307-mRNA-1//-1//CDS//3329536900//8373//frame0
MSSWAKVANGARLVAVAVAKQAVDEAGVVTQRAVHHGLELSGRAQKTMGTAVAEVWFQSTQQQSHQSQPESSSASSEDADQSKYGTSPYESQLRKKRESELAKASATPPPPTEPSATPPPPETTKAESVPNPFLVHAQEPVAPAVEKVVDPPLEPTPTAASSETETPSSSGSPMDRVMGSSETQIRAPSRGSPVEETITHMQEGKAVPSSRLGRAVGFASLGVGLVWGATTELVSRVVASGNASGLDSSVVTSNANADRFAATLCRMRGAALKMGQMLSIQDEALLPPALTRALNQVRQGADAMPHYQLVQQLESQLGKDWRDKFESFEDLPFAAASIGQVHKATIRDPDDGSIHNVVVKVQYPGVASSIESDLRNLTMLIKLTGFAPKGLFLENVVRVGRDELKVECNYLNEMANQEAFRDLVEKDPLLQENNVFVPKVIPHLTTEHILVSEYSPGGTIDKVQNVNQEERDRIGRIILYLTMQELFVWRLMQTDPNWGNFLYDVGSQRTTLIDFGATREYPKEFVDGYLRIVWANANRDEETLMTMSRKLGFLTGEENELMLRAHKLSGYTLGEPFSSDEPFDFKGSQISSRMGEHTSVFMQHRLTPPPEEVYTLHRKLAGAFMLCIKVGAKVQCRDMLEEIVRNYKFEDGLPHPMEMDSKK